jgi:hypothetical protein
MTFLLGPYARRRRNRRDRAGRQRTPAEQPRKGEWKCREEMEWDRWDEVPRQDEAWVGAEAGMPWPRRRSGDQDLAWAEAAAEAGAGDIVTG